MQKRIILLLLSAIGITACQEQKEIAKKESLSIRTTMDSLFERHQYFETRKEFEKKQHELEEKDRLLIAAKLKAVFNKRSASNQDIEELLLNHKEKLSTQDRIELLKTEINNQVFLFEYAGAAESIQKLMSLDNLSSEDKKEFSNTFSLLESLKGTPAQTIVLEKDVLPITKDRAGLSRIPVRLNSIDQKVVFDTGANFSVITDSLALRAGIEIIGKPFKVKAVTGGEVESRLGVAKSLQLGKTSLENVVFLVFPESSLSFPEADYTIDAILGFPVINALKEVMLIKGKQFIITGGSSTPDHPNLALDFLTPVVEILQNGKSLPFTFDTGANSTALYEDYFELHEEEITSSGRLDSLHFGGAGGSVKMPVYYYSFSGRIGKSEFNLDSVAIHQENFRDNEGIYGNLGQDVLRQFDTLILDFEKMGFGLR